ncbi:hypothetical protein [Clostridium sp. B9]|uniref:hypothetical protein n=1 Tax=Clostridium sp. B9 TaxID=3423224 RepID=UPI003D2F3CA3
MKKRKILSLILAIVSTVTFASGLVSCDKGNEERNGKVVILSDNAVDDAENEKIKVINEYNFDLGEREGKYEGLNLNSGKLYLETKDEYGTIIKIEELIFQDSEIKKKEIDNFPLKTEFNDLYFVVGMYKHEILDGGKMRIYDDEIGKEIVVDSEKFRKVDFVDEIIKDNFNNSFLLEDYFINFKSSNAPSDENGESDYGRYSEIRWYDLEKEEWNSLEIPKGMFLTTHIIGKVDNTLFIEGEDSRIAQFSNKIYSLDLKSRVLNQEIDFQGEGEAYYSFVPLSKEKILVCVGTDDGQEIRMFDLINKVPIYLCNGVIENTNWQIYDAITPSKDKFFYGIENGENIDIRVIGLGNNEVASEGKVYEYDKNNKDEYDSTISPQIIWSDDGNYLIIGEKIKGENKFKNLKILELNQ